MFKYILLTQGKRAKVDAEDYEELMKYRWCALWSPNTQSYYAIRRYRRQDGIQGSISMHRQVKGLTPGDGILCDHQFGDTLDNRKLKLRICNHSNNTHNRRRLRNNKTHYQGVDYVAKTGVYRARIAVNNQRLYLGSRKTARAAYNELYVPAAIRYHGEFARVA